MCQVADGSMVPMYGPGTVVLRHFNGKEEKTVVLTGVWYAPGVKHQLLSVVGLVSQGF